MRRLAGLIAGAGCFGLHLSGTAAHPHLALESSPCATIDAWKSPVLVVQADDDRDVPFSQSAELIEALRAHHVDYEEMILPNEIHNLARYASWMSFFHAADRYFERHLQASAAGVSRP